MLFSPRQLPTKYYATIQAAEARLIQSGSLVIEQTGSSDGCMAAFVMPSTPRHDCWTSSAMHSPAAKFQFLKLYLSSGLCRMRASRIASVLRGGGRVGKRVCHSLSTASRFSADARLVWAVSSKH